MTTFINTLAGTAGVLVDPTNSAAGGDAFTDADPPADPAGASVTYDTSHGGPAYRVVVGGTSGPARRGWSVNPTNSTATQYMRFYWDPADIAVAPGGTVTAARAMNDTSSAQCWRINITSNGFLQFRDNANTQQWISPSQLASGTKWRVEVLFGGTTSTSAQIKIFNGESTTPTQDSGVLSGINLGGPTQTMWFGQGAASSNLDFKIMGPVGWSDSTWLGPDAGAGVPACEFHVTGIPTSTSITIAQKWVNAVGKTAKLVLSTTSDLATSPITGSGYVIDDKGWVKPKILSGLSSNTKYYGGILIDDVLDVTGRFSFTTSPTPGSAASFGLYFGSCRWDLGGDEAFAAMENQFVNGPNIQNPIAFLADMGDNGYPDFGAAGGKAATEDAVLKNFLDQGKMAAVQSFHLKIPYNLMFDNHDAGGNNSDKNGSWVAPVLAGFKRAIPHRDLSSSTGAVYHSFEWGRVRFIVPDNRSERDPYNMPNGPTKRMWSQEQEDWFIERCTSWPWAICVLGGMHARQDAALGDRWGSYPDQWKRINDRLDAADVLKRLIWLFGDRHALCADDGTASTTRGIPQAGGAPFEQGSVDLPANEPWSAGYYNPTPNQTMRAYGEAAFIDGAGPTITFQYIGRTVDGVSRVTMTKSLDVTKKVLWKPPVVDATFGYVAPPALTPTILGHNANNSDLAHMFTDYPNPKLIRLYWEAGEGAPSWSHPVFGLFNESIAALMVSWKDSGVSLSTFMTNKPVGSPPIYLTWAHEPEQGPASGDPDPATYRQGWLDLIAQIADHPRRSEFRLTPIFTEYYAIRNSTWYNDFGVVSSYNGVDAVGFDIYDGGSSTYRTPTERNQYPLQIARQSGKPLVIPEWGIARKSFDTDGSLAAQAMRDNMAYLRQQPDVPYVAYFNQFDTTLTGRTEETNAFIELLNGNP